MDWIRRFPDKVLVGFSMDLILRTGLGRFMDLDLVALTTQRCSCFYHQTIIHIVIWEMFIVNLIIVNIFTYCRKFY